MMRARTESLEKICAMAMEGAYPAVKHCRLAAIPGALSRGNPRQNNVKWLIFGKNRVKACAEP